MKTAAEVSSYILPQIGMNYKGIALPTTYSNLYLARAAAISSPEAPKRSSEMANSMKSPSLFLRNGKAEFPHNANLVSFNNGALVFASEMVLLLRL